MSNIVWTPLEDGRYRDKYGDYIIIDEQFLSLEDGDEKTRCVLPVDVRLCRAMPAPAPLEMPQPDWSQAPEWAMWWTCDPDGDAYWWQLEPHYPDGYTWDNNDSLCSRADYGLVIPLGIDWRTLKQQRPEEADNA